MTTCWMTTSTRWSSLKATWKLITIIIKAILLVIIKIRPALCLYSYDCTLLIWETVTKRVSCCTICNITTKSMWTWLRKLRQNDWATLPLSPSFFWNLLVFWQNVLVNFPDPMLSVNLEYFIIKNEIQNFINIQSRRNQTFTGMTAFIKVI